MSYTRAALGFLNVQYRSVLKKCALINLGIFALGAIITSNPANADYTSVWNPTYDATSDNYNYINLVQSGSQYVPSYANINILANRLATQGSTVFTQSGTSEVAFSFDNANKTGSGTIAIKLPHNSDVANPSVLYYTYTYTVPTGYVRDETRKTEVSSDITGKYFYDVSYGGNGGAIANAKTENKNITAEFIQNYITKQWGGGALSNQGTLNVVTGTFIGNHVSISGEGNGGAIRNKSGSANSIVSVVADFIGNYVNSTGSTANGGAVNNESAMGSFTGNFIGNYAQGANGAYGGVFRNKGIINSITGSFVANYAKATNNDKKAHGGVIYNYNTPTSATIGNINGDFIYNYASGTSEAFGGAIYNSNTITSITGDFIGNQALSKKNAYGGAIYNYKVTTDSNNATIGSLMSDFIGNNATTTATSTSYYARGGAIYNTGTITSITNANFLNNSAQSSGAKVQGGAIYTTADMTLTADGSVAKNGGVSVINGNWVSSDGGATKKYEAIYVDKADATLTFDAKNNGEFVIGDSINGAAGYDVHFTGDGTGVINLYNDVTNADVTADNVTMNLADTEYKNYTMRSLVADSTAKWAIDFDAANKKADKITTVEASSGTILLDSNDLISGGDFTSWDENTRVQIISNTNATSTLKLALTSTPDVNLGIVARSVTYDAVAAQTNWEAGIYGKHVRTNGTAYAKLNVTTTNTAADSIGLSDYHLEGGEIVDSIGDTLAAVNQSDLATRSFDAVSEGQTYTVTEDLRTAGAGDFTINGISGSETIELGNYKGFELDNATTLNLNNVKITGSNGVISSTNNNAVVNMNNSYIEGNINGTKVKLVGVDTIDGTVKGSQLSVATGKEAELKGLAVFTENGSSSASGGAILSYGTLNITGTQENNIVFTKNEAISGGAVYNVGGATMNMSGVNFQENNAANYGGAVYNATGAKMTVSGNSSFTANNSDNLGGAIMNNAGELLIEGTSDFSNNTASNRGGAVYVSGTGAILTVNGKTSFTNNTAGLYGGAVGNSASTINIIGTEDDNIKFTENEALLGGAVLNLAGTAKLEYVEFTNNEAHDTDGGGGAISQYNGGSLDINHSTFVGNKADTAEGIGGAIQLQKGSMTLKNSTFSSNTAYGGGAIYNELSADAMIIDNVVFTGNVGEQMGGAVVALAKDVTSEISNSVFTDNKTIEGTDVDPRHGTGGAVHLGSQGKLKITDSEFKNNSAASRGGAIATRNKLDTQKTSRLEVENSIFENNTAVESGGAIYSNVSYDDKGTTIKDSTFKNNSAANGGAVFNDHHNGENTGKEYIAHLSVANSTFEGNSATEKGGALYNVGTIDEISNVKFIDNSVVADSNALGGAIYTNNSITITTDGTVGDGESVFKGNYVQAGGDKQYQAIYIDGADKSLTFETNNEGTLSLYDFVDGVSGYTTTLTGDGTGTLNLYNDVKNSDVTIEKLAVNTDDGNLHDYEFMALDSANDTTWAIDFDIKDEAADTFATSANAASSGVITLNKLNLVNGEYTDASGADFKVQVLKTQGDETAADLQLALTDELKAELEKGYVVDVVRDTVVDEVTSDTKWSDEFREVGKIITTTDKFGLATTATLNDSIGVISEDITEEQIDNKLGDTLAMVNAAEIADKTFTAAKADDVYKAEDDLGATFGNVTIKGVASGEQKSTVDLDGHNGFVIGDGASVTLTDAKLVDNQGKALVDIETGGKMSLQNSSIESVNINANGELDVANNKVAAKQATFGENATLKLLVKNIDDDHGIFMADSFDIADGAKLNVTLGQNPLNGKDSGEVALLAFNDGTDIDNNNFTDDFYNNMYKFERKADKSGIYGVYRIKSGEEISRENGGTLSNQGTAAAWVDGASFADGAAAAVADSLAELAQTDGTAFNEALTAIAPNDDGMVQSVSADLSDRLLITVDNHLIQTSGGAGLSSGDDGYPDLSGISTWAKGYYGRSKLQNHGDTYGFHADSRGLIAGIDKKVLTGVKVGGGMQYDDTDAYAFQRNIDTKTTIGFVYGEYRPSNWFTNGVISYGVTDYDEDKTVVGQRIGAHYKAEVYSLQGLVGYTFKYFTPEIGARYYRIKRHGYVDGIGQSVSGENMDLLRTTAGVKAHTTYGMFKPTAYVGIMYDAISDSDNAIVSLTNGSSYAVHGKRLPRFGVEIGVGVSAQVTDKLELSLGYETKFRKDYQDHSGMVIAKYEF